MTADFSGRSLHLPPGILIPPAFALEARGPCWVSQLASERLQTFGEPGPQAVVGGHTVWGTSGTWPGSIMVSHPNRLGASEDIAGLLAIAKGAGVEVWVEVDPYLLSLVELSDPLRSIWSWPGTEASLYSVGERCQQAADAFRRRVRQLPGTRLAVEHQAGRPVALITSLPGRQIADRLAAANALIDLLPVWEGLVICWIGWWHTRQQIEQLVGALGSVLEGRHPAPIDDDNFERLPSDLPRRRLDTIWSKEESFR